MIMQATVATHCQTSLDEVERASEDFAGIDVSELTPSAAYHRVKAAMHSLCWAIETAERNGVDEVHICTAVSRAHEVIGQSAFLRRLQTWPRGYPGDFESIEFLISGSNKNKNGTLRYYAEECVLRSPAVAQHRNKVRAQAHLILDSAFDASGNLRLLSLGCGASPDLRFAENALAQRLSECVLVDIDPDALARSEMLLPKLKRVCQFTQGDALRVSRSLDRRFDLIVSGGLFDYLPDRVAILLLRILFQRRLEPGGAVFFTNMANTNPYRGWMHYLFDWNLIERSENDIRRICGIAGIEDEAVDIRQEETGLTHLVTIRSSLSSKRGSRALN
jgi:SAM-dependent methyltransferase